MRNRQKERKLKEGKEINKDKYTRRKKQKHAKKKE